MLLPRPTTVPGFSTELQPTSTWSPRMAPNFFLPVSIRSAPVSYTHLDVYKRQAECSVRSCISLTKNERL